MKNVQQAYDAWAGSYNDVVNPTRDMELKAKQLALQNIPFSNVLELGCGTGKNTEWLLQTAAALTSVDFSANMLAKAKEKIKLDKVKFIQADINQPWDFVKMPFDLITCSLVLEHIKDLEPVFKKAFDSLVPGGHFYIGELHPFKQYGGSKARFEKEDQTVVLDCYTHHVSDFLSVGLNHGFNLAQINESFDSHSGKEIPRILTLLFRKKSI